MGPITLTPIGVVKNSRHTPVDDYWADVQSTLVLDAKQFTAEALYELETFSHLEVIFAMHLVKEDKIQWGARHPRNNKSWPKVGIFAQRAKSRPNRLGMSRCCICSVDGLSITVSHLDAIDGTPILDIKPYLQEMGPIGTIKQPSWSSELMTQYYASKHKSHH